MQGLKERNIKALSRAISLVENNAPGSIEFLQSLPPSPVKVVGITGPPGAGKSTLTDALIGKMVAQNKSVAVLCIDPSSPFHQGAVLGDRIRMSQWYTHPGVYIRSLATRGALGGLSAKAIEITDVIKAAGFDLVIVETAGVGQTEVEIASLADLTLVVLVPEAGDEVQTMKAGLMEIADAFVINKADRPDADVFEKNLRLMLAPAFHNHDYEIPIVKTVASQQQGIDDLASKIESLLEKPSPRRSSLLAERAWQLIQSYKMRGIDKNEIRDRIDKAIAEKNFNLYKLVEQYTGGN